MNIAHWLTRTAIAYPDRPALLLGDELVADYRGFGNMARGLASGLAEQGICAGDRVAIFMTNSPEYLVALYAIWTLGAVAVPVNGKLHGQEAAWIIANSGAKLAFVSPKQQIALAAVPELAQFPLIIAGGSEFQDMAASAPMEVVARREDDLAWLFYTSGTTGRPKGVQITHGMLTSASLCYPVDVDDIRAEDAAYYAAPMSHGAGLYAMIHVRMGCRHICPPSGGYDAAELLNIATSQGPLSMFMAPTMVRRLTSEAKAVGAKGEGIKTIVYGGGPMYVADIVEAVDWFGPRFVQIYGQGECPMSISVLSRSDIADRTHQNWRARLASVGRAHSAVEVIIGDQNGNPLPVGEIGEIMVRGQPVMSGYWQNEVATAKTIKDGWLMTGDIGQLDHEGYLTLADRSKDVIISGGSNIYPREVEELLLHHPDIAEISVVGKPSAEWGEEVVAFVVLTEGKSLNPDLLDRFCLDHIARFKRPKRYFELEALPKNNYGKVLKTELRTLLEMV